MIINTNLQAQKAAYNLSVSQNSLNKSLNRLSSGQQITDPSDDAAGLAMGQRLDAQLRRLDAAKSNVGSTMSYLQTQDGYLQKVSKALQRMSEISILAQDVIKQPTDLSLYDKEFQTLASYISDISGKDFNGVSLFNGASLSITTDPDPTSANKFTFANPDLSSDAIYTSLSSLSVTTSSSAATALDAVKSALTKLASDRAAIGSTESRMNYTLEHMQVTKENLTAASSRIQDVDIAVQATEMAKYNIMVQAGTAMLAQANTTTQVALRLLQ